MLAGRGDYQVQVVHQTVLSSAVAGADGASRLPVDTADDIEPQKQNAV